MAKSYFLINTQRANVNRAQMRRLCDRLDGQGTSLSGVFADKGGAIESLAREISTKCRGDGAMGKVNAVVAALTPINFPKGKNTCLSVPFRFSPFVDCGCENGAGAVALGQNPLAGVGIVRNVDLEGLTLVGVSVLRQMGVPAFFSYSHMDPENEAIRAMRGLSEVLGMQAPSDAVPTAMVLAPGPMFISLLPPAIARIPLSSIIRGFEIVDDDAMRSILLIKAAYKQTLALMKGMASGQSADNLSGFEVAASIGHSLHTGLSIWDEEEAYQGIADATSFLNPGSGSLGMASIRTIVESRYADSLLCPPRHNMLATMVMVDPEIRIAIAEQIGSFKDSGEMEIQVSETASESLIRIAAYQRLADAMREHVHETSDCPIIKGMN